MPIGSSRYDRRHGSSSAAAEKKMQRLLTSALEARTAGRLQRAVDLYEAALKLDPGNATSLCAYGFLLIEVGRPEVAIEIGRRAIGLAPGFSDAHQLTGMARRRCGHFRDAIADLGRVLELAPASLTALVELGCTFLDLGNPASARPFVDAALDLDASSAAVQAVLGRLYESSGRPDDAIAAYRRAIALDPDDVEAHANLGNVLRGAGDLPDAIVEHERSIALAPHRPDLWSNLLLTLQCSDCFSAREVAAKHYKFGKHFASVMRPIPPAAPVPLAGRRLRIGYLSSHFRRHAVAKFFQPLLRCHDRSRFEVHCYYNGAVSDDVTDRIRDRSEHFTSVSGLRDGYVAAQIRRDAIDILVDLDGHTAFNRLPVYFLRPAPLQVTWLGYLATTGVPSVDFRLTDARADPPGVADELHTEALWRLPTTAWCYEPYDEAPEISPPPLRANRYPTFVSLNDPAKVTPTVLELWARIMGKVPGSRLILHVGRHAGRILELSSFFAGRGVRADRLALVDRLPIAEYLGLYGRADIALDTWPCAGGTTTCDALWMGVPVVTLTGEASYSRTGASLLSRVGMDDLATDSQDAYVGQAIALAGDLPCLTRWRFDLRPRMRASGLLNEFAFARDVEAAFVEMWERKREGRPRSAGPLNARTVR